MDKATSKNIVFNMIKTISSIVFPILTYPYVARVLGADNVGKVNYSDSIVSYFSLIATLGITTYAIRESSKVRDDKEKLSVIVSELLSINVVTTILSYLLMFLTLVLVPSLHPYVTIILIQSISMIFSVIGADWLNSAMEDFKYITIRTFIFQVFSLISLFLFVRKKEDYLCYVIITLIAHSGANLLNFFYRRRYCSAKFTFRMQWKKHLKPIMLLFAMLISQTLLNNIDITMLGFMKSDYDVGLYSTAYRVIGIISQVVTSIAWVVMPQLTIAFEEVNYKKINMLLEEIVSVTCFLGIPCVMGVIVYAKEIVLIIGGKEYIGAAICLQILAISMLISFFSGIIGNMIFLPSGRDKRFMVACILATVVNILCNVFAIPKFGIEGASVATVISTIVIFVVLCTGIEKEIHLTGMKNAFIGPLIEAGVIVVLGSVFRYLFDNWIISLILGIVSSIALYPVILILCKNKKALEILNHIRKIRRTK